MFMKFLSRVYKTLNFLIGILVVIFCQVIDFTGAIFSRLLAAESLSEGNQAANHDIIPQVQISSQKIFTDVEVLETRTLVSDPLKVLCTSGLNFHLHDIANIGIWFCLPFVLGVKDNR